MNQKANHNLSAFIEYLNVLNQQKKQHIYFNHNDKIEIPIIEFNLEKKFGQFIGSKFNLETTDFVVKEAYQRNAFILELKLKVKQNLLLKQ